MAQQDGAVGRHDAGVAVGQLVPEGRLCGVEHPDQAVVVGHLVHQSGEEQHRPQVRFAPEDLRRLVIELGLGQDSGRLKGLVGLCEHLGLLAGGLPPLLDLGQILRLAGPHDLPNGLGLIGVLVHLLVLGSGTEVANLLGKEDTTVQVPRVVIGVDGSLHGAFVDPVTHIARFLYLPVVAQCLVARA